MPLPISKSELNRLGEKLIAASHIAEADLSKLALVLAAYQEALERVKTRLSDLGFSATDRVKTTGTLTDKLRRSHGMQLSRMQDLAGARIVVEDLLEQDKAVDTIRNSWDAEGSACKVIDRREQPSFGYRAVHVVVQIDGMPVEIQIRTKLQDVWAQIVERLGDRWGRDIRYGGEPEDPEAHVRSGELIMSRREALASLIRLSEAFAGTEAMRADLVSLESALAETDARLAQIRGITLNASPDVSERLANRIPAELMPLRDNFADALTQLSEPVDPVLLSAGADTTGSQLVRLAELTQAALSRAVTERSEQLQKTEEQLRAILQLIADATDEGA